MGKLMLLPLLLALTLCVASACTPADQKALLAFKAQFNDPSGVFASWSPQDPIYPDCCGWKGVRCEFVAPGRVTSVSLQGGEGVATVKKGVTGAGNSLGDLTGLKFLVLTQIRFSFKHPVPPTLAKLKSLETLGLSGTQFTGTTLPSFLSTLTKLNDVTIEGNYFPDGIPASFGNMKALGLLSLPSNGMKTIGKSASSLTKLKNLNYFSVASNAITGRIPAWVGLLTPVKTTKDVYLQENKLTGPIPKSLSGLAVNSFRPGNPGLCGAPLAACS
ncbi:hypothetical protein M758_11G080100 [Ceratodon purpureus]|uniref:Leucine-rich repeat-containing N-terminal plant-type domain-containing protein n=1 Tax=Ceratodon purpureus TaxID=3225 RepID=A0A8T0GCB0_CERPU|nr:hypothetical protein KC19_11G083200 [Ceratodon purpureus]KAG0601050.1 hypothetical protein M758_11G080100 [Ceratodon purpureus]